MNVKTLLGQLNQKPEIFKVKMPRPEQKGLPRPSEWQDWPAQTREHYKKLFTLQEYLRAHLMLAQELARRNYNLKQPRKTKPIPIRVIPGPPAAGKQQENYLRRYLDEKLPDVQSYLISMRQQIKPIKEAFTSGRHPKWYKQILRVEKLTLNIWEKMEMIQANLIVTLRGEGETIKKINEVIIEETAGALEDALRIREALLFFRPNHTIPGVDDFGIEAILEAPRQQPEQHFMDLTPIWHRSQQHKKTQG